MQLLLLFTVLLVTVALLHAFEWVMEEELPSHKYFTFSERYMFSSNNGPILLPQGDSYINVDVTIDTYMLHNQTLEVGFAVYAADEGHQDDEMVGICDATMYRMQSNDFAHNVEWIKYRTQYKDRTFISSELLDLNGTYYHRQIDINYYYKVRAESWHNVVFLLCADETAFARYQPMVTATTTTTNNNNNKIISSVLHRQEQERQLRYDSNKRIITTTNNNVGGDGSYTNVVYQYIQQYYNVMQDAIANQIKNKLTITKRIDSNSNSNKQDAKHRSLSAAYQATASLQGTITFHNPYGYLPAEMYGMLPCEALRMIAYIFFFLFYVYHYHKNQDSVLPLHNAFLAVFFFALAEAAVWFSAYEHLNITGVPYCCPFPGVVVAALLLQVFRQTFARTLLLVVALGYGIVRPKLLKAEWIAIAVISGLYLATAIVAQIEDIAIVHNYRTGGTQASGNTSMAGSTLALQYRLPGIMMDVIFITWIYIAISSTIRILNEFNQQVKLAMYKWLVATIGVFVGLFSLMTVVYLLDALGLVNLPWQISWLQEALWELLNFAVLAAVCVICLPTESSRFLAYASQLPQEDPDDGLDAEIHGNIYRNNSAYEDDLDEYDIEMIGSKVGTRNRSNSRQGGFDTLPMADDDEEYGLDMDDD